MNQQVKKEAAAVTRRSFTLVETIMVIMVIGILAGAGSWFFLHFMDTFFSLPDKLQAGAVMSSILDAVCEGDGQAGGARFSNQISESLNNRMRFIDQDGKDVIIELNNGKVYRTIDAGTAALVPYYMPASWTLSGKDAALFKYYDDSDTITTASSLVKRVEVFLVANTTELTKEVKTSVRIRE